MSMSSTKESILALAYHMVRKWNISLELYLFVILLPLSNNTERIFKY
jgi:hypothetical protein